MEQDGYIYNNSVNDIWIGPRTATAASAYGVSSREGLSWHVGSAQFIIHNEVAFIRASGSETTSDRYTGAYQPHCLASEVMDTNSIPPCTFFKSSRTFPHYRLAALYERVRNRMTPRHFVIQLSPRYRSSINSWFIEFYEHETQVESDAQFQEWKRSSNWDIYTTNLATASRRSAAFLTLRIENPSFLEYVSERQEEDGTPVTGLCGRCEAMLTVDVAHEPSFGVVRGEIYCEGCLQNYTHECNECSTICENTDIVTVINPDRYTRIYVCNSCATRLPRCQECETVLTSTYQFNHTRNHGDPITCNNCFGEQQTMHDMPALTFAQDYGNQGDRFPYREFSTRLYERICNPEEGSILKSQRIFGIELECIAPTKAALENFSRRTPRILGIGTDASIHTELPKETGIEIRTPRLGGKNGEIFITSIAQYLSKNKFRANHTCGFHLHLDGGTDFIDGHGSPEQHRNGQNLKNLFMFYLVFEDVIASFLPITRRSTTSTDGYARSLKAGYDLARIMNAKSIEDLEMLWYQTSNKRNVPQYKSQAKHNTRYFGANFHTLIAFNHIEIRYHSGTVNPRKIIEWTNLHAAIMDRIADGSISYEDLTQASSVTDVTELTTFFFKFLKLSPDSKKYFLKRQLDFKKPELDVEEKLVANFSNN